MIRILLALIMVALVTVFSAQNAYQVTITFVYWSFKASLAIVVFLSAVAGALIAMIGMASRKLTRSSKERVKKKDELPDTKESTAEK
jgi:uncharacterized integral membrane protein